MTILRGERIKLCLLVMLVFLLQSCFTLRHGTIPVDEGIELTNVNDENIEGSFEGTKKIHHFIGGLVSPDDAGIEELVSNQIKLAKGKKAVNVRIEYKQKFVDGLVGALTLGIYTPFTLTVSGDVVK